MSTNRISSATNSPRFRTWPITAVRALEPQLREMGLKIDASDIDGTTTSNDADLERKSHLSDALVSVGTAGRGGTGSFVSSQGLILTNWHVAYDAVRQASLATGSEQRDYVKEGFVAKTLEEEIPGPNYEVWITKKTQDVSDQILAVLESHKEDPLERANRVRDVMQEIAQTAQQQLQKDGIRCDVQEMLPNESYVLFTYERIRDVRIVYVPPKSLGNFGGDTDNFEWPRHTADFTLLRAYVGPNGEAADQSSQNIPYQPKAFLPVQKDGAAEGEFVFLLGFPGRTMRYAPSSRLLYSDQVAVPNMVQDFRRKLQLIAQYENDSDEAALKLGSSKKGLANEFKRSQGKLVMMRKLGLISEREIEEQELMEKVPETKQALEKLADIYNQFRSSDALSSALEACRGIYAGSALLAAGHSLHEYLVVEQNKPDAEREASYRERNLPFLCKRIAKRIGDIHSPHEVALVQDAIAKLVELEDLHAKVQELFDADTPPSSEAIAKIVATSQLRDLTDGERLKSILQGKEEGSEQLHQALLQDPFVKCASILWKTYEQERDVSKALLSDRDALFAELLEAQRTHSGETMYPDCNGSLRLSAGYVEGYTAADAVECKPKTTLAGLFDKVIEAKLAGEDESSSSEFKCPDKLYQLLSSGRSTTIGEVPVCLLYSTDTVGGNSGSPVMNANGELVGINFDRQRQGLMNEFKWSKAYSRSIGVDIRYMLWLIGEYDGASNLVDEMLSK